MLGWRMGARKAENSQGCLGTGLHCVAGEPHRHPGEIFFSGLLFGLLARTLP